MMKLVLTLLGPDRPGHVEAVAAVIASHGGSWLQSRMAHLAGHFAGILCAEVPEEKVAAVKLALARLEARGLRVTVEPGSADDTPRKTMELEVVGLDRPGIVKEVSALLAGADVNVEELVTDHVSAPMSGEMLFSARARLHVPAAADLAKLRASLHQAAQDLLVEITLADGPAA